VAKNGTPFFALLLPSMGSTRRTFFPSPNFRVPSSSEMSVNDSPR